jgi:hypothetical protein
MYKRTVLIRGFFLFFFCPFEGTNKGKTTIKWAKAQHKTFVFILSLPREGQKTLFIAIELAGSPAEVPLPAGGVIVSDIFRVCTDSLA